MKKEIEALKEARRKEVEEAGAIANLDNDAPTSKEFYEIAEDYINLKITLEEFHDKVVSLYKHN